MPTTFQALWITVAALLPGALYTWMFERQTGAWGVQLSDRVFRFIGASAVFHAVAAPATYLLYSRYIHSETLIHGQSVSWWLWPVVLAYVIVPSAAGWVAAVGYRERKSWASAIVGPAPAPTAWEHFFTDPKREGWIRLRLKSDNPKWIYGYYGKSESSQLQSYAAGFSSDQDIFLSETFECDQASGLPILDANNRVTPRNTGVLIRWDQVSHLEYITPPPEEVSNG